MDKLKLVKYFTRGTMTFEVNKLVETNEKEHKRCYVQNCPECDELYYTTVAPSECEMVVTVAGVFCKNHLKDIFGVEI